MTVVTTERDTERDSLNATYVQSVDCCPYCGAKEHEPLDTNHVQPHPSSCSGVAPTKKHTEPHSRDNQVDTKSPTLIRYSTRTEAQVYLVANLAEVLSRDLANNLGPLTGEISNNYLSFALEDICNLNAALIGLYEILAKQEQE